MQALASLRLRSGQALVRARGGHGFKSLNTRNLKGVIRRGPSALAFVLPMNKSVSIKPVKSATTASRLTSKRRGEVAEAAFLHKAASLGFGVAKSWGDSDPFDFLVQSGSHCWRGQVESAYAKSRGGYGTSLLGGKHRRVYTAQDIDFLVAYAVPEDAWCVVPVEVFRRVTQVRF